jgi:hypothetical protein
VHVLKARRKKQRFLEVGIAGIVRERLQKLSLEPNIF